MNKRILIPNLLFVILVSALYSATSKGVRAVSLAGDKTSILYDASSGQIPDTSLMHFTDFPPGGASLTYSDGVTVMDTTITSKDTFAGWVASQSTTPGFPLLDRTTGVQVNFTLQVESETHANNNRAGFSLIVLDQDAKGIELSFWQNEIWAQSDENTGGLFRHGEGSAYATTTGLTDYRLTLGADTYTLTANSELLLTGPVRDYSAFNGFPDPYQTPNFLFLGDDTTSSQARVRLRFVSVTGTEPVIPTIAITSADTSIPIPTSSLTPPPSATANPSPTPRPANPVSELCPFGWLFSSVMLVTVLVSKMSRRRRTDDL
jgi:hypothetical protein